MAIERVSDYTRKILNETKARFSLARLLSVCGESGGLRDGVEHEICSEAARAAGLAFDLNRPVVPWGALVTQKRDATVSGTGAYLAPADTLDAIDTLRPWSVSVRAGISLVPGLRGNAVFPRTSANVTAYWLNTETTSVTASTPTLGQLALTPRTAGALVNVSRLLLTQSTQTEQFIRRELLRTIGTAVDHAVLNGPGTAEPTGVLNAAGIGATSGTSLDWSDILAMQQTVAAANADDAVVSFIGTPAVRALLAARERASGSGFIWQAGSVAGQPAFVTSDMPTGTLICAAWPELLLGLWGPGIELAINPNDPDGFKTGTTSVRCLVSCDVGLAHAAAFNAATAIN
jgi:HK97 family phage major capsid protein